jgi:hypothetical protein
MDAAGAGDAGVIFIPGTIVIPGVGAVVGVAEGFGAGVGVAFLAGAGVAIGIPGMGPIVGSAARIGEMVVATKNATTLNRVASKGTSPGKGRILRVVVSYPGTPVPDLRFHLR